MLRVASSILGAVVDECVVFTVRRALSSCPIDSRKSGTKTLVRINSNSYSALSLMAMEPRGLRYAMRTTIVEAAKELVERMDVR